MVTTGSTVLSETGIRFSWSVDMDAKSVTYTLAAPAAGRAWIAMARANSHSMLTPESGIAIVGTPIGIPVTGQVSAIPAGATEINGTVSLYSMSGYGFASLTEIPLAGSGISFPEANDVTGNSAVRYDVASRSLLLTFTRRFAALGAAADAQALDMAIDPGNAQGYIFAIGYADQAFRMGHGYDDYLEVALVTPAAEASPSPAPAAACAAATTCNAHGTCNSASTANNAATCMCTEGYVGDTCGDCAELYTRTDMWDGTFSCSIDAQNVDTMLSFSADGAASKVGAEDGSQQRRDVESAVRSGIAKILGFTDATRVVVNISDDTPVVKANEAGAQDGTLASAGTETADASQMDDYSALSEVNDELWLDSTGTDAAAADGAAIVSENVTAVDNLVSNATDASGAAASNTTANTTEDAGAAGGTADADPATTTDNAANQAAAPDATTGSTSSTSDDHEDVQEDPSPPADIISSPSDRTGWYDFTTMNSDDSEAQHRPAFSIPDVHTSQEANSWQTHGGNPTNHRGDWSTWMKCDPAAMVAHPDDEQPKAQEQPDSRYESGHGEHWGYHADGSYRSLHNCPAAPSPSNSNANQPADNIPGSSSGSSGGNKWRGGRAKHGKHLPRSGIHNNRDPTFKNGKHPHVRGGHMQPAVDSNTHCSAQDKNIQGRTHLRGSRKVRHNIKPRHLAAEPTAPTTIPLIVQITILPDSAESSGAATSVEAGNQLKAQAIDASSKLSALLEANNITTRNDYLPVITYAASTVVRATPDGNSTDDTAARSLQHALKLNDQMAMAWTLDDAAGLLHMEIAFVASDASKQSWFGIAFNDNEEMIGGDAIAVEPGKASGKQVNRYILNGQTMGTCPQANGDGTLDPASAAVTTYPGILPASAGSSAAASTSAVAMLQNAITSSSVTTIASFSRRLTPGAARRLADEHGRLRREESGSNQEKRSLAAGAAAVGSRTIDPHQNVWVTFAWGPAGMLQLSSHTDENSGAVLVNFGAGTAPIAPASETPWWALLVQGALCGIATIILMPLALMVHRYGQIKNTRVQQGPSAPTAPAADTFDEFGDGAGRYAHSKRAQNQIIWTALMMFVIGLVVGIVYTDQPLASLHSRLGIATSVLLAIAAVLSTQCVRPREYNSNGRRGSDAGAAVSASEMRKRNPSVSHQIWRIVLRLVALAATICGIITTFAGIKDANISSGWYTAVVLPLLLIVVVWIYLECAQKPQQKDATVKKTNTAAFDISPQHHKFHFSGVEPMGIPQQAVGARGHTPEALDGLHPTLIHRNLHHSNNHPNDQHGFAVIVGTSGNEGLSTIEQEELASPAVTLSGPQYSPENRDGKHNQQQRGYLHVASHGGDTPAPVPSATPVPDVQART